MAVKLFKHKIFKETFWSLLTKGITFLLFYLTNIFLARILGVVEFGSWSFFYSIFSVIVLISYLGINNSAKVFIARTNDDELSRVLISSVALRVFVSCVFSLIFFGFVYFFLRKNVYYKMFLYSAGLIFLMGVNEYLKSVFSGLHKIKFNVLINVLEYGLKLLLAIILLVLVKKDLSYILFAYIIACFISSISVLTILFTHYIKKKISVDFGIIKNICTYSLPLLIISIGFIIATEIDIIMIGVLRSKAEVGIYSIAKQFISKLPHISLAIAMGSMPVFARIDSENIVKLRKLFFRLIKINTLIYGVIAIILILLGKIIINVLYGEEYSKSYMSLVFLIPYLLAYSYSVFLSSLMDYQKLAKKRAINLLFLIVINIVLNYILIPLFGAAGAAGATSVSYLPYLILNFREVKKILDKSYD